MAGRRVLTGPVGDGAVGSVGAVVAGVRLTAFVGEGASGRVWAGTDESDGSRVAVKLLHGSDGNSDGDGDGDRDAHADVEGALLQGLRHPHVLAVRRVSTDPPAVVTELAGGGSVASQVRARGCLSAAEVVTVLAPLADALAWVHGRGVVHGDVSGTNVLFVDRGRPVLADLGGARLAGRGEVVATPGYAAPEVLAGDEPTAAADVHGLAAVAWLALTGTAPPAAEDRLPLRLLAPECPDELVEAVTAGLDPDPAARPGPLELAAAARAACPGEPVRLVPSAALGVRADEAVTYRVRQAAARERAARAPGRWRPGRRSAAVLAATLGALLFAGVVGFVTLDGTSPVAGPAAQGVPGSPAAPATTGPTAQPTAQPPENQPIENEPTENQPTENQPTENQPAENQPADEPSTALTRTVTGLVHGREAALRAGDLTALDRVHHPAGSTLATDSALLLSGPVDVRYEVLDVHPDASGRGPAMSGGQEPGPVRALVRLRTAVGGAAPLTEQVLVELDRHDGTWLVRSVTDAQAG